MSVNSFSQALAGNPTAPLSTVIGPQAQENTYRWATVTQRTPSLAVQLDGDSQPLPLIPDSLIEGPVPAVGARVWVQLFGRRVIVLGVSPANSGVVAPGYYTDFVPVWNGLGIGTGAINEGWYSRIGDTVNWQVRVQLGTSPTIADEVLLTLPVLSRTGGGNGLQGTLGSWILRKSAVSPLEHWAGSVGNYNIAGTQAVFSGAWKSATGKSNVRLGPNGGTSTGNPYAGGVDVAVANDILSAGGTYRAQPL